MASSRYFSSMTQEIFISDVLVIMILTPSRDSTSNILAATANGNGTEQRWDSDARPYQLAHLSVTRQPTDHEL